MTKNLSEQQVRQLTLALKDMDGSIDLRHTRRVALSEAGLKVDHQALRRVEDEALTAVQKALPWELRGSLSFVAISARPFATRINNPCIPRANLLRSRASTIRWTWLFS